MGALTPSGLGVGRRAAERLRPMPREGVARDAELMLSPPPREDRVSPSAAQCRSTPHRLNLPEVGLCLVRQCRLQNSQ